MATYNLERLKAMVVDDNNNMVRLIETMLHAMGVEDISSFTSPEDALRELNYSAPDFIITDYRMAPINGLELIRRIRSDSKNPNRFVPIILLTAYTERHLVLSARTHAGADAVLAKPLSVEKLYSCIVSFGRRPRPFVKVKDYFGPDRRLSDRPFEGLDKRANADGAEPTSGGSRRTGPLETKRVDSAARGRRPTTASAKTEHDE